MAEHFGKSARVKGNEGLRGRGNHQFVDLGGAVRQPTLSESAVPDVVFSGSDAEEREERRRIAREVIQKRNTPEAIRERKRLQLLGGGAVEAITRTTPAPNETLDT